VVRNWNFIKNWDSEIGGFLKNRTFPKKRVGFPWNFEKRSQNWVFFSKAFEHFSKNGWGFLKSKKLRPTIGGTLAETQIFKGMIGTFVGTKIR